jgi:hypothetical protein
MKRVLETLRSGMKRIVPAQTSGVIVLETVLGLFVLLALTIALFMVRLYYGPVNADFARPYVEAALADRETGMTVRMDKIVLYWPEMRGPLLLGFKNTKVYRQDGTLAISVDEAALGLSKARLLLGQVAPTALILKKPSLRLIRQEDNRIDIGLAQQGPVMGPPAPGAVSDPVKDILEMLSAEGENTSAPRAFADLDTLKIENAEVIVDDHVVDMTWSLPGLDATIRRDHGQMKSQVAVRFSNAAEQTPALKIDGTMDLSSGHADVKAVLEYFEVKSLGQKIPQISFLQGVEGKLNASMSFSLDDQRRVTNAEFTAICEAGSLNIPELSGASIPFSGLGVLARYDGQSGVLNVERAQMSLKDSVTVSAGADFTVENGTFNGPLRFGIEKLSQADLGALWPEALKTEAAYEWAVQKLSKGQFSDVYAQIELKGQQAQDGSETWSTVLDNVVAGFNFSDMDVDYRAPLKPVTGASGKAAFDMKAETMIFDFTAAKIMDMDVSDARVSLSHIIEKGRGQADIEVDLKGSVPSLLTYLQDEPLAVKTPIDVAASKGTANVKIGLHLPTHHDIKMADVKIEASGTVSDLTLPKIVRDLTLSGGPLDVSIKDNLFHAKGKAKIEDQDAVIDYSEFLSAAGQDYASKATVSVTATPAMRTKMGMDLSLFMDGPAGVNATYTSYPDKTAEADVRVDLGPSNVYIEPFDYIKPPGKPGSVALKAKLAEGRLKTIEALTGSAPDLTLGTTNLTFRPKDQDVQLSGGQIRHFTLGETVGSLGFEIAPNGFLKVSMDSPVLDFRPFMNREVKDNKPYAAPAMQLAVTADKMKTADGNFAKTVRIYAYIDDQGRYNQMEMDALVGAGAVRVRYTPDESGKRTFRLDAADAGAALKAFDIYGNIIGGTMVIYGEPIRGVYDRNLKGRAEIANFRVVRAPSLAKLLGLMSLSGVTQALGNEGLVFSKLETRFDWLYRPGGSLLVLKDGRTSGNSLGLTFDGTFDNAAQAVDVQGTIIPLSGINKVIGSIPLVGDIITGGTGSLIAATYSMKGQGQEVKTFVNPLSVLTPGILRRILFENGKPGAAESRAATEKK